MEESVEAVGERYQLDLEGGIAGYRPLPPARRKELQALPLQSDIFVLEYGPEAQQAYAERRERVRDDAIEVLRMFHQVLLPDAGPAQLEGFIDKYGLFCWEILEPLGLVEIEGAVDRYRAAEADYRMSGRPLLDTFVHLSLEWE